MYQDVDQVIAENVVPADVPIQCKGEIGQGAPESFFLRVLQRPQQGIRVETVDVDLRVLQDVLVVVQVPSGRKTIAVDDQDQ